MCVNHETPNPPEGPSLLFDDRCRRRTSQNEEAGATLPSRSTGLLVDVEPDLP